MRIVGKDGKLSAPLQGVPKVYASGQGGLLDVQIGPDFASSGAVYLSYADPRDGSRNGTSVARGKLVADGEGGRLEDVKVIFRQEPSYASGNHFGSRIVFTRDGSLFVTLGDRYSARDEAQNPANHLGKLVRLMADGSPYAGNPKKPGWRPEIWSIGHRNVQGAALHPQTGKLWTIEHGARGGDEINVPEAGKNYGWPVITYGRDYSCVKIGEGTAKPGLEQPIYYWDPVHRPLRRGVLHRRSLPGVEGQPVRRRAGRAGAAPPGARRREGRRRGEAARRSRRAHPRRAQRPRRRALAADRQSRGARAARGAGATEPRTCRLPAAWGGSACPGDLSSSRSMRGCSRSSAPITQSPFLSSSAKAGLGLSTISAECSGGPSALASK